MHNAISKKAAPGTGLAGITKLSQARPTEAPSNISISSSSIQIGIPKPLLPPHPRDPRQNKVTSNPAETKKPEPEEKKRTRAEEAPSGKDGSKKKDVSDTKQTSKNKSKKKN